jgi:HK97 family phage major capsid protein
MAPTIQDLIRRAEQDRSAADRAVSDATAAIERFVELANAAGGPGAHLTAEQDRQFVAMTKAKREAADRAARAAAELGVLRQAAGVEAEVVLKQAQRFPTGARPLSGGGGEYPAVNGPGARAIDAGSQWVRTGDGRPGVVERGQRFADHPVAAEQIARAAERDRHIVGMHGGLGQLVRSMSTTSGSGVVPQVWAADVIDRARNLAAVLQAGAQIVPMDAKTVQIGRLTADPTSGFRAEGSPITASDPTFDNVTLTATTLTALVIGSLEWFQDTTPGGGADQLVAEALAKVIALQIDLVALFGQVIAGVEQGATGVNLLPTGGLPSPNPRGILANLLANAASSVLGAQTNGTVQTATSFWGEVLDTIWTVRDFNESPTALIWPSHLARIYAKAVDTQNNPMRIPADVDAIQKYVSNQIPSGMTQGTGTLMSDLFVGDFSQLLIGQRLDLNIQTLTERYAELGQVGILATWRGDIQLARPRAFAVYRFLKGS